MTLKSKGKYANEIILRCLIVRNYCQQRLKWRRYRRLNRLNDVWQTSGFCFGFLHLSQAEFDIRKLETGKFAKKNHHITARTTQYLVVLGYRHFHTNTRCICVIFFTEFFSIDGEILSRILINLYISFRQMCKGETWNF